jgi:hypothetical protein
MSEKQVRSADKRRRAAVLDLSGDRRGPAANEKALALLDRLLDDDTDYDLSVWPAIEARLARLRVNLEGRELA